MFEQIDRKKDILDENRPLSKYTLASLQEKLLLEWTYNSNAIEGNTLIMNETKVVLEGITVGGKTFREHLEVINHRDAIQYVEQIIGNNEYLSEWQIKNIHHLVLKGIEDEYAEVYRKKQVLIAGAKHTPPAPYMVQDKIDQMMNWYYRKKDKLHPVERSAMLHT